MYYIIFISIAVLVASNVLLYMQKRRLIHKLQLNNHFKNEIISELKQAIIVLEPNSQAYKICVHLMDNINNNLCIGWVIHLLVKLNNSKNKV